MIALSASLLSHMQPGVSYAPGTLARQVFGCACGRSKLRQCGIFFNVVDGLGLFKRAYAGPSLGGLPRRRELLVYTGDFSNILIPVCSAAEGEDWLEFPEYRTRQIQKVTQLVVHYLSTRGRCTWTKVLEDIHGHYTGRFSERRVYDVVTVLKVLLYTKK